MVEPFTPGFFRQLQQLKIHTRRSFLGSRQGIHQSSRRGHGLEFHDYRLYSPGDDFRHIDWNVYGRTDRLYVREFREEQDLNVFFLVDTSNSMRFPIDEGKFDLTRHLTLALGYVALSDGDTVSVAFLGQKVSPKFSGPSALPRLWNELRNISPRGTFDLRKEVRAALAQQKYAGKCFFISDFLTDIESTLECLDLVRAKNFDLTLLQVLSPSELQLDPNLSQVLVVDAESRETLELALDRSSRFEYAKALANHVEQLENYCRKASIAHVLISSAESVADVVLTKLPELRLLK